MRRRDPASLAQRRIWRLERLGVAGSAHHLPLAVGLEGDLDVRALVDACEAVVARHPILGGAIHEHDDEPWLGPARTRPHVAHVDLSTSPAHRVTPQLADLLRRETVRRFDLERGPLARFTLCRLHRRRFLLLAVVHHIVFDRESGDMLVRDLSCLYGAFANGSPASLPPLPPFREQAADERARADAALARARERWAGRWREPGPVALPGLARPVHGAEPGRCVGLVLDRGLDDALDGAARALGATRFDLILAGLQALLHRYGNQDTAISVALSTRSPLIRDCVGPFVNALPVTARCGPGTTFGDLVAAARDELRAARDVREVPLASAVPAVGPRLALSPVSLSYRRRAADAGFPALDTTVDWTMSGLTAGNALHWELVDGPGTLAGSLQYAPGALDAESARRIGGHLTSLLASAAANPGAALSELRC